MSTSERRRVARERARGREPASAAGAATRSELREVGRFTLLRELGSGSMGVVYAAYDPELDRKVAVKLVQHAASRGSQSLGRAWILREAQAMARLSHPNVAAVYEVGTHEGQVFLAMEFIRGESLREWMARAAGAGPWREVRDLFLQAGRGLAAAHRAGLVHRDFKPDKSWLA